MANTTTTFLNEAATAARGTVALLIGNRQAPSYFDFRQVGVVGSFIALLIGLAAQAFGPHLMGRGASGAVSSALILAGLVLALQFGAAWLLLRLLNRGDGFVPFVVSHNWVIFFQSLLAVAIFVIFGEPFSIDPAGETAQLTSGSIPFLLLGIAALVISVNIARLIMTLRPRDVAAFVISQSLVALLLQPLVGGLI